MLLTPGQVFAERIETQLHDAQGLPIRKRVNDAYDKVVSAIFATLQHIAKMERAETQSTDDKGQLSYNVVMIGEFKRRVSTVNSPGCQRTCTTLSMMSLN